MKVLIVSDTHKSHRNLEKIIEREQPFQMLIHLGDVEGGEDYIEALADCPVHIVRGNNDFFSELPGEQEFFIEGRHIFATHGHVFHEKNLPMLKKGDILLHGHTHVPVCHETEQYTYLNPGSVSIPKENSWHGYLILEDRTFVWKDLDGEVKLTWEMKDM